MEEQVSIKVTPDREWVKPGEAALLAVEIADLANRQADYVLVAETEQGRFEKHGVPQPTLFEEEGRNYAASVVRLKPGQRAIRRLRLQTDELESAPMIAPHFRIYPLDAFAGTTPQHLMTGLRGQPQPLGSHQPILRMGEPAVISGPATASPVVPVTLTRASEPFTEDEALWWIIRDTTEALSFNRYRNFVDAVLCNDTEPMNADLLALRTNLDSLAKLRRLPFPDTDAYRVLKVATEAYLQANCGVDAANGAVFPPFAGMRPEQRLAAIERFFIEEGIRTSQLLTPRQLAAGWAEYITPDDGSDLYTIPYLALVAKNLDGIARPTKAPSGVVGDLMRICQDFIYQKLVYPCLIELIWSYWHEEGMLVQTIKAIAWRFQNRRGPGDYDPLALLEIDPLRPLNNFIWGYIQDEQHRLTLPRRTYEYDHHYGLRLFGKAVPEVRGADTRSRFLEAFHNLLFLCSIFYKEDDDTTVVADGFPVLNALREVHLILTQGAHNQYGDLPSTARQEMMMEQWILARPEFREFLPRRVMVAYPEPWMHSVETMKTLQGWTDTSILHFRELARYGERILLSARFGNWTSVMFPQSAANWARFFRAEVQGYIHAYRAVTGVDLTDRPDATMPGVLLRQRLTQQLSRQLPERRKVTAIPKPPAGRLPAPRQQAARAELPEWSESGV